MTSMQTIEARTRDVELIRADMDRDERLAIVRPPSGWTYLQLATAAVDDWIRAIERHEHDDEGVWSAVRERHEQPLVEAHIDLQRNDLRTKVDKIFEYLSNRKVLHNNHKKLMRYLFHKSKNSINRKLILHLAFRRYAARLDPPSS